MAIFFAIEFQWYAADEHKKSVANMGIARNKKWVKK